MKIDFREKLIALETVDDVIAAYRYSAELMVKRKETEKLDYVARKDLDNSIRGAFELLQRLMVVREVVRLSLDRGRPRSRRKTSGG